MKKVIMILCIVLCLGSFCSCSTNDTQIQDLPSDEVASREPTCDEVGHDYVKGVCEKCGDSIKIDMTQRVSDPSRYMECSLNSANGMKTQWFAKNISGKTIKYCHITFRFRNRVGDSAYDELTGKDFKVYKLTGPIEPNEEFGMSGEIIGYFDDCYTVTIEEITLEYMDGTQETGSYGWSINEFHTYEYVRDCVPYKIYSN